LLSDNGGLTTSARAEKTGGDRDQVLNLLRELKTAGRFRRTGQRRGTRWHTIIDEDRIRERAAELEATRRRPAWRFTVTARRSRLLTAKAHVVVWGTAELHGRGLEASGGACLRCGIARWRPGVLDSHPASLVHLRAALDLVHTTFD
jgi:hypothetical protein